MFKISISDGHGNPVLSAVWQTPPTDDEVWDLISDSGLFRHRSDVKSAVEGIIWLRDRPAAKKEIEFMNGLSLHKVKADHD